MPQNPLSTVEAARMAGVGPSSIKRWADRGILPCVRTAGGHRRYDRLALERFIRSQSSPESGDEAYLSSWITRLIDGLPHQVDGALLEARARLGAWHRVADELGAVITELGRQWESGRVTVADEHLASESFTRALRRVAEVLPSRLDGPRCLLACAEGDEHTLALSLAELCLRELGWVPHWLGRKTPTAEIVRIVQGGSAQMVALSASSASNDTTMLAAIAEQAGAACRERGSFLVLGGCGAWPDQPGYGVRLRSFGEFHARLMQPENTR